MEFEDVVRARRMVRTYDPSRPVPREVLARLLDLGTRAPSAGFSQGWDFVVLSTPDEVGRFWSATTTQRIVDRDGGAGDDGTGGATDGGDRTDGGTARGDGAAGGGAGPGTAGTWAPDRWLSGMRTAPALILCLSDRDRYLDRYAEPDKGWSDRDEARWPVPYWDVDTGMASMIILLAAVDAGLVGCFFGVDAGRHAQVAQAFSIPAGRRIMGVISLGHAPASGADRRSPSLRRGRRAVTEVAHDGTFGAPFVP